MSSKRQFFLLALCMIIIPVLTGIGQDVVQTNDYSSAVLPFAAQQSPAIQGTSTQWTTGAPMPVAKRYHTVASLNGDVFVFAGEYLQNNALYYDNKCYKYNVASNSWTQIANFPIAQFDMGTAQAINGKIYITAGIANQGPPLSLSLGMFEYDPVTNVFTKKASLLSPRMQVASGVLDGKMYLVGGRTILKASGQLAIIDSVMIYDPVTDTYSAATNYPKAVCFQSSVNVQNSLVISGGYNNTFPVSAYIADTYVGTLNGSTLNWTRVKDYPIGPSILMCGASIGSKAYYFSGRPSAFGNPPTTSIGFSYDVPTDTWQALEFKPTGVLYLSQIGTDGKVLVAPGGSDGSGRPLDIVEIFNPASPAAAILNVQLSTPDIFTSQIYRQLKKGTNTTALIGIINRGGADLTWSAAIDPPSENYLTVTPASGTTRAIYDTSWLSLKLDASGLASNTYSAAVKMTSNDPNKATMNIPVTLLVTDNIQSTSRNVLMEEFTGTWCPWCPYGIDIINQMLQTNPTNLTILEYHGGATIEPLQTAAGNQISGLLGASSYPSAAFDRTPLPYKDLAGLPTGRGNFKTAYALRAADPSPAGIKINNYSYNASTKQVAFDAEITFYQGTNLPVRLNIVITESGFNYQQRYTPDGSQLQFLYPYTHNHVVRQVLPDAFGDIINASANNVAPLAVVTKHYSFTSVDSAAANAKLIAIAHISDGTVLGPVLQSTEIDLTGTGSAVRDNGIPQEFSLSNYPNPVGSMSQPNTTITFALPTTTHVTLQVYDALGRNVATLINAEREPGVHYTNFDASHLSAGIYYYTIKAGTYTETKKMLVVK